MLTIEGLNSAARAPDRLKAVINWENVTDRPKSDAENELRITNAERYSALAKDEIESGFSHVSEQAIVMLWGALEVLVYDYVVWWLQLKPALLTDERFSRHSIKIQIGHFLQLTPKAQLEHLIKELARNGNEKTIIDRLESCFSRIDQGAEIKEPTKRTLIEMYAVRNVIVHRNGIIDARCANTLATVYTSQPLPAIGTRVTTNPDEFARYEDAVREYVVLIINRHRKAGGKYPDESGQ
jgi:hypothetical protein